MTTSAHAAAISDRAAQPSDPTLARKISEALGAGNLVVAHETLRELWDEAKQHNRDANYHKRKARYRMQEFDRFRTRLEALGVKVVIETKDRHPSPLGGTSGHHQDTA